LAPCVARFVAEFSKIFHSFPVSLTPIAVGLDKLAIFETAIIFFVVVVFDCLSDDIDVDPGVHLTLFGVLGDVHPKVSVVAVIAGAILVTVINAALFVVVTVVFAVVADVILVARVVAIHAVFFVVAKIIVGLCVDIDLLVVVFSNILGVVLPLFVFLVAHRF